MNDEMRKMMENMGCKNMMNKMMSNNNNTNYVFDYGTEELKILFEDWLSTLEEEILEFAKSNQNLTAEDISKHFKLTIESSKVLHKNLSDKKKL